jgi:hypothetical protein
MELIIIGVLIYLIFKNTNNKDRVKVDPLHHKLSVRRFEGKTLKQWEIDVLNHLDNKFGRLDI